ncbi:MAG: GNAT family N-acetyltransferase [Planctomycetota bacterium]|jgi:diamine N-acetyltransferase
MTDGLNPEADVSLREVTKETLPSILKLKVAPEQEKFVAPNAVSIAEAHFENRAWFRAVCTGDAPVGFVMLYLDQEKPEYYVWRFMIDRDHQGKGYGAKALAKAIEHVRGLPNAKELWVSYVPEEGNPSPLYRKFGFEETGKVIHGEILMRLTL